MFKRPLFNLLSAAALAVNGWCADAPAAPSIETEPSIFSKTVPYMMPGETAPWLFAAEEFHLEVSWMLLDNHEGSPTLGDNHDALDLGAHYYVTRYFSVGAEFIHAPRFDPENLVMGTFRARLPWEEGGIALIILGGGGGSVSGPNTGVEFEVGAGIELRWSESVSISADYRYIGPDPDVTALRVGLNVIF